MLDIYSAGEQPIEGVDASNAGRAGSRAVQGAKVEYVDFDGNGDRKGGGARAARRRHPHAGRGQHLAGRRETVSRTDLARGESFGRALATAARSLWREANTSNETAQESSSYLRRKKPVRVSRRLGDLAATAAAAHGDRPAGWVALGVTSAYSVDRFVHTDERFEFATDGSDLLVSGIGYVQPEQVRAHRSRPTSARTCSTCRSKSAGEQLAALPWVEQATVARIWTHQIWAHVEERKPVAFVRVTKKASIARRRSWSTPMACFSTCPKKPRLTLPVISGVTPDPAD